MFVNLIISKFSTKYHYSSTTVNGIGRVHKLGKQNRQQPGFTNGNLIKTSPTSHGNDKSDEKFMQQTKNK